MAVKEIKTLVERVKGEIETKDLKTLRMSRMKPNNTHSDKKKLWNSFIRSSQIKMSQRNEDNTNNKLSSRGKESIASKIHQNSSTSTSKQKQYKDLLQKQQKKKEKIILSRIEEAEKASRQRRLEMQKLQKQNKIFKEIEHEKSREKKALLERRNEYKRVKLLEHIERVNERSFTIQKQNDQIAKLRQLMRKTLDFKKYQVKTELEKLKLQYIVHIK